MQTTPDSQSQAVLLERLRDVIFKHLPGPVTTDGFQPTVQFPARPDVATPSDLTGLNTAENRTVPPGFEALLEGINVPAIPGISFSPFNLGGVGDFSGGAGVPGFNLGVPGLGGSDVAGGANALRRLFGPERTVFGGGVAAGAPDLLLVRVRNVDASTWPAQTPGMIDTLTGTPIDADQTFEAQPFVSGGKTAVALQSISPGQTGAAVILGVAPILVFVTDIEHRYAKIDPDIPWLCRSSAQATGMQILWRDPAGVGVGVRQAFVLVGPELREQLPLGLFPAIIASSASIGNDEFRYTCQPATIPDDDTGVDPGVDPGSTRRWTIEPDAPLLTAYNPFERVEFGGFNSSPIADNVGVFLTSAPSSTGAVSYYYIVGLSPVDGACV